MKNKEYYNQLQKLKEVSDIAFMDTLDEESSIEDITKEFNSHIELVGVSFARKIKRENNKVKSLKSKKILVVDSQYLLPEYKGDVTTEEIIDKLESKYGVKVFLIDASRTNLEGIKMKEFPPVYLI